MTRTSTCHTHDLMDSTALSDTRFITVESGGDLIQPLCWKSVFTYNRADRPQIMKSLDLLTIHTCWRSLRKYGCCCMQTTIWSHRCKLDAEVWVKGRDVKIYKILYFGLLLYMTLKAYICCQNFTLCTMLWYYLNK